jgi:hypothetical protein
LNRLQLGKAAYRDWLLSFGKVINGCSGTKYVAHGGKQSQPNQPGAPAALLDYPHAL